jgi:hypothetical protein
VIYTTVPALRRLRLEIVSSKPPYVKRKKIAFVLLSPLLPGFNSKSTRADGELEPYQTLLGLHRQKCTFSLLLVKICLASA